jgi:hypothetical protein
MIVYCIIIDDRHIDIDVEVWVDGLRAIERAKEIIKELCHFPEDIKEEELTNDMVKDGWVYNCKYSCEGDGVRVVRRELGGQA